jgi:hypothetical protein
MLLELALGMAVGGELEPEQLMSVKAASRNTASDRAAEEVANFRVIKGSSSPASARLPGSQGSERGSRDAGINDAVRGVVVILSVVLVPVAIVACENWQLAPAGKPAQLKLTFPAYPFCPTDVSVDLAALPAAALPELGDTVNTNCTGGAMLTWPLWLTRLMSPPASLLATNRPGFALP